MTALFLVLFIVSAVDVDTGVKESLWLFFAWSLSMWSVGLLVVWQRETPFELCSEGGLRQASPATALIASSDLLQRPWATVTFPLRPLAWTLLC